LHVGILRAHNALMARDVNSQAATTAMRRRYQWAVLHDFLPRVCDKAIVSDVLANGPSFWKVPDPKQVFMPLEFSAAAYRFGHSMIRSGYSHNVTFNQEPFLRFFTFTALSGSIAPFPGPDPQFPTLPDNWIIDWPRFFSPPGQPAAAGRNP